MSLEANVCTGCGFALKDGDAFCPNCGKIRSTRNINFGLTFEKYKKIFIISLALSLAYPLIDMILNIAILRLVNPNLTGNGIIFLTILSSLANFIILAFVVFLSYFSVKGAGLNLPKEFIPKFLIIEFLFSGLASSLGYSVGFILTYETGLIITLLINAIIIFIGAGIFLSFLFTLILLIQNDGTETKKAFYNPKTEIALIGYILGFIFMFLNNFIQFFVSYIINITNPIISDVTTLTIFSYQLLSLLVLMLVIILLYAIIKKQSFILDKKNTMKNSLIIYLPTVFGSFTGLVVFYILSNMLIYKIFAYNFAPLVLMSFIIASLGNALNLAIIFLSLIFILQKIYS